MTISFLIAAQTPTLSEDEQCWAKNPDFKDLALAVGAAYLVEGDTESMLREYVSHTFLLPSQIRKWEGFLSLRAKVACVAAHVNSLSLV